MLTDFEKNILKKLEQHFYDVVPLQLETYCVVVSSIACEVLKHFGIGSTLYACQVRHYSSKGIFAVGFVENKLAPSQWNGHVICKTRNWFLDASLYTLSKNFQIEVPLVVKVRADDFEKQEFAHHNISEGSVLRWFQAPEKFDPKIPEEPEEIIQQYAKELITMIDGKLKNQ